MPPWMTKPLQRINQLLNTRIHPCRANSFFTYETEFVLFSVVLENSVLPIGWDSSHVTLKVTSELQISEVRSFLHHHEKH